MTFEQFVTAALAIAPEGGVVFVRVEYKHHPPYGDHIEFCIWDSGLNRHFNAANPEAALTLYRIARTPPPDVAVTLAAVGGMLDETTLP